jgi:hypothetical protein
MNTPSMKDVSRCFKLFDAIPWQNLAPDTTNQVLLKGRGEWGSYDYICAAKTSDSSVYIMYLPKGRNFWLNVGAISEKSKTLYWYNPRNGRLIKIGGASKDENFGISAPDENDWVLLLTSDPTVKLPNTMR